MTVFACFFVSKEEANLLKRKKLLKKEKENKENKQDNKISESKKENTLKRIPTIYM